MERPLAVILIVAALMLGLAGAGCPAQAADPAAGTWSGGAGIGFLANTPDGTAFALNANGEYFINRHLSIGPLLQLAFTGDLRQIGLSGQAKYWFDLAPRLWLTVQGGIGFVHTDFLNDDTSFLIPLGVGVDYAVTKRLSVTGTFLLNFTDLNTGGGTGANVMPGITFGVRF